MYRRAPKQCLETRALGQPQLMLTASKLCSWHIAAALAIFSTWLPPICRGVASGARKRVGRRISVQQRNLRHYGPFSGMGREQVGTLHVVDMDEDIVDEHFGVEHDLPAD